MTAVVTDLPFTWYDLTGRSVSFADRRTTIERKPSRWAAFFLLSAINCHLGAVYKCSLKRIAVIDW
jgi:hypothetical protein